MGLKIKCKCEQEVKVGETTVTVKRIRGKYVELLFHGPKETKIVGPNLLKKLTKHLKREA